MIVGRTKEQDLPVILILEETKIKNITPAVRVKDPPTEFVIIAIKPAICQDFLGVPEGKMATPVTAVVKARGEIHFGARKDSVVVVDKIILVIDVDIMVVPVVLDLTFLNAPIVARKVVLTDIVTRTRKEVPEIEITMILIEKVAINKKKINVVKFLQLMIKNIETDKDAKCGVFRSLSRTGQSQYHNSAIVTVWEKVPMISNSNKK